VSQSALSHTVRRLEAKLGLRLLTRATRSVAPTEAGERLIETLRPAFDTIDDRLATLTELHLRPGGTVRNTSSVHAARAVLWPVIYRLTADNPDLSIEVSIEDGFVDIVADRYDAGVRLGEALEQDMIAVPIGLTLRMAAFASPSYLTQYGMPLTPYYLANHNCISLRMSTSGGIYAWEFKHDGEELRVKAEGQLVFNDVQLIITAALAGHGVAFMIEDHVLNQFLTSILFACSTNGANLSMDIISITPVAGSLLPRSRWCLKRFATGSDDVLTTRLDGSFRQNLTISGRRGNGSFVPAAAFRCRPFQVIQPPIFYSQVRNSRFPFPVRSGRRCLTKCNNRISLTGCPLCDISQCRRDGAWMKSTGWHWI
jgi:DNA-binding transcriptional LysR family regulator